MKSPIAPSQAQAARWPATDAHILASYVAAQRPQRIHVPSTSQLVEASPVDPIWGIGLASGVEAAADPRRWRGLNLLGFALMEARDALRGHRAP